MLQGELILVYNAVDRPNTALDIYDRKKLEQKPISSACKGVSTIIVVPVRLIENSLNSQSK
jgi:hypothetical protein